MGKKNLRADAAKVLFQVLEQGQSLRECLPDVQEGHSEKDKAWLQEMVFGVLRQLPLLQYWLRQLLDKPLKARFKIVEQLLLLGFYQLAFSRVSTHAAVSETVGACPALKANGLKGLVNGILRNFIRKNTADNTPNDPQVESGLPKWLFKKLQDSYPHDMDSLINAMQIRAPIWLRVNRQQVAIKEYCQHLTDKDIDFELSPAHPDAIILQRSCDVTSLPGYKDGWFAVQDGAAQKAAMLLAPQANEIILDACAAPGGKTCHILEQQPGLKKCIALDVDEKRLTRVSENLSRLKLHAELIAGDGANPDSWWDGQQFDRILLDAPCSATGVIRRHPDIKWLRKSNDIDVLVALQSQILDAMWPLLKSGGTMLYATCSILPQENRQQVAAFLKRTQSATLDPITSDESAESPGMQILPGDGKMDGFYYARLIKS